MADPDNSAVTPGRREDLTVAAWAHVSGPIEVRARQHVLHVDEAQRYGGHDVGANHVEHMLAGLVSASLVVLRLAGHPDISRGIRLRATGRLNVERVMGRDSAPVFEHIALFWEVDDRHQAEALRALLPVLAARRPGQALIESSASYSEDVMVSVGPAE